MITELGDMTSFKWATVTQLSPLRIKLDGDSAALLLTPESTVDPVLLAVNDRVRVELSQRKVVIHGQAATGKLDGRYYTKAQLDAGQLDTRYYTESEIAAMFALPQQGRIPSTVQVGSGSASVAADGTVTFTGCSSVALNGVFDGLGMDAYEVIGYLTSSVSSTVVTRMRSAGTDIAGTNYTYVGLNTNLSTGPVRSAVTGAAQFGFWRHTVSGTDGVSSGRMLVFNPGKALTTWGHLSTLLAANGDRFMWEERGNGNAAVADGLSLIASAGTISGFLKVVKLA